jgi:hypothetical protein
MPIVRPIARSSERYSEAIMTVKGRKREINRCGRSGGTVWFLFCAAAEKHEKKGRCTVKGVRTGTCRLQLTLFVINRTWYVAKMQF